MYRYNAFLNNVRKYVRRSAKSIIKSLYCLRSPLPPGQHTPKPDSETESD